MPDVNLPLSGPVAQAFKLWTSLFTTIGNQIALINVNVGKPSDPVVEQEVLSEAASYGKQLGRIEDALVVLVRHFDQSSLSHEEKKALSELKRMIDDVADVRDRHSRQPTLRVP